MAVASRGGRGYAARMSLLAEESAVMVQTRALCERLAADPQVAELQACVERFLNDDAARLQYQSVHEQGEGLHEKQHAGIQLGTAEIRAFEAAREALFENAVARDFLAAQQELEQLRKQIGKYVSLTLELGRVPTEDDFASSGGGCCGGGGCGC